MTLRISPRRMPPVYSPLSAGALLSAVREAAQGDVPVNRLREELLVRYGAHDAVLLDSGTSALSIAMRVAGGPVAIPAFCCFDIATACDGAGVDAILYDVDPETLAPSLDSIAGAIRSGARTILVVHLYGIPAPIRPILEVAAESGVVVIEDAAQGSGGAVEGRRLGSLGSFGVLSFGRGKGITGGGGGCLLLNDLAAGAAYRAAAIAIAPASRLPPKSLLATVGQWALGRPSLYIIPSSMPFLALGETVYHAPHLPAGISAFSAALARTSLEAEPAESATRRRNALWLASRVPPEAGIGFPSAPDRVGVAGFLRLPLFAKTEASRRRVAGAAARRLGVLPSYPVPLSDLSGFGSRARVPRDLPGARALATRLFTAPVHRWVSDADLDAVATLLAGEAR